MTTSASQTLRGHANDLIAVYRHVMEAMTRHAEEPALAKIPGAQLVIAELVTILARHMSILERRVEQLGGQGAIGTMKEAVTSVTGFAAGLFGQVRSETASRILRDDYIGATFLLVCTTMFHAASRALHDADTAALAASIMRDLPPLLLKLQNLIPHAVVIELAPQHPEVSPAAADITVTEIKNAWRPMSAVAKV